MKLKKNNIKHMKQMKLNSETTQTHKQWNKTRNKTTT